MYSIYRRNDTCILWSRSVSGSFTSLLPVTERKRFLTIDMSAKAKLYWNPICPFVHRAWIASIEKQAPLDLEYVSLSDMPEWYTQLNSRETLPSLKTPEGKMIFESNYVVQYIDEHYGPRDALVPGDAVTKYRIRLFAQQVGDAIGALYGYLMTEADGEEEAKKNAKSELDRVEALLTEASAGPFFLGDTFSFADIAIVPFLDRFRYTLKAYHNFDIFEGHPRLKAQLYAASLRPSLTGTMQPPNMYIESYKGYAKKPAAFWPAVKLYSNATCPYADRARIAANLKKVPHELIEVSLTDMPDWYKKINPNEEVPAAEVAPGVHIRESLLVVQFFDDAYSSGVKLMPRDPQEAADSRFFIDELGESTGAFYSVRYGDADAKDAAENKEQFCKNLGFLNGYIEKQSSGPFFLGAQPSYADVAAISFLARYQALWLSIKPGEDFAKAFPGVARLLDAARKTEGISEVVRTPESYMKNSGV